MHVQTLQNGVFYLAHNDWKVLPHSMAENLPLRQARGIKVEHLKSKFPLSEGTSPRNIPLGLVLFRTNRNLPGEGGEQVPH